MALATRELELIIIARDHASATLARVGGAMAILGAGAARLGVKGIGAFVEVTNEAIEFRRQVALAFTQAEIAGLEYNDVLNLIRDTARDTAVPIEDLTDATFDIFSSLTLDNLGQARGLLEQFTLSAVAGQAPIRDIARATIGWINALDLAPTAENAARILDVQFELVRKGIGTYEEFGSVVGKAIPPFIAANQGIEEMAAAFAFATRGAQSAAEAATSASRAVELLYGPKAIVGLEKIGIAIEDEFGKFRPMDELLADIVEKFRGMSDAEKKLNFKEIFGQGRIQARRFFDMILAEGNFEEYLFLLDAVKTSSGEVAIAFDIMMAEPAVQLEVLKNRFVVLRQEMGDQFIPFLTGKLMPALDRLLDWWEEIDDIQKENLVKWSAFATLFLTVGGAITAVVGSMVLILGLLKAFTGSIVVAVGLAGGFALGISAIAAAIALAIIDWDKFVEIFGPWWDKILEKMDPVVEWLKRTWPEAWAIAEDAYQSVLLWFEEEWPAIWEGFKSGIQDWLENEWPGIWEGTQSAVEGFGQFFVDFWNTTLRQPLVDFWNWIVERWDLIWAELGVLFEVFVNEDWGPLWDQIVEEVEDVLPELTELLISLGSLIIGVLGFIVKVASVIWDAWGEHMIESLRITVQLIGGLLEVMVLQASGAMDVITGILTLDFDKTMGGFAKITESGLKLVDTAWITTRDSFTLANAIIADSVSDTESDIDTFTDNSIATLERLAREARTSAWSVRNSFAIMSPGSPFSLPLTTQIANSLKFIQDTIHRRLASISLISSRMGSQIRESLSVVPQPAVMPRLTPALVGGPMGNQEATIRTQINIDKLESKADPFEIAAEIGWHALNS